MRPQRPLCRSLASSSWSRAPSRLSTDIQNTCHTCRPPSCQYSSFRMTRPSSHSSPSPPASREPRARAQAASPPFAAEATAAAAAAASAASTAVASPRAAERGRGPPLHGVRCGRGIGRIGALRSRTRWPTRWAASRSESRLGTARSAGEAGSSRVDAPRTSRPAARPRPQPPAEASCGRLVCREASACAWLVVRLTCRARGASEAALRAIGPCVMVGGAGGASGRSAHLVVVGTGLSHGRAPAYAS